MRKYLFVVVILAFIQNAFSQTEEEIVQQQMLAGRRQIDSLKKVLLTSTGNTKVDCLNELAGKYMDLPLGSWQVEADSARPYALQAYREAKRIRYKKGLGYSYLNMGNVDCLIYGTFAQQQNKFDTALFNSVRQNAKNAISIGEELTDNKLLAEAYFLLQWLLWETKDKKNIDECISYMKKALSYYEKIENNNRLAFGYRFLGYLYGLKFDLSSGIEAMKKSITYYRKLGDEKMELWCINTLSQAYWSTADFENWLDYGKRGIYLAEKLYDKKSAKSDNSGTYGTWGAAFFWMSVLYQQAGDYEGALAFIKKARNYYPEKESSLDFWAASIGNIYRLDKNFDSALYYLQRFANKVERTGNGLKNLASLYIDLNEFDKALPIINAFIEQAKKDPDVGREGVGYVLAANAYFGKKDFKTALKFANQAILPLNLRPRQFVLMENYDILSKTYHALGNNDSAYHYLKIYTTQRDSLLNRQFLWKLNNYKKEAEEERKTSQIKLQEQKLKQEATLRNGLIIGVVLLSLLGLFIYRNQHLKRKNEKLSLQKKMELQQLEAGKRQAELHQRAIELEMQALRAQMNPHFIFNCLSSINRFIFKNDNKAASDYLTRFSRLIRMVLIHSQKKLIPLEDELEMIRLYLDLERLRFKDAFDYSITTTNIVDPGTLFIPPILLQPFCENAVWHGLMHKEGKGHLTIELSEITSEGDKTLHCIIEDDGIGRKKAAELKSKSAENEKSMGLKITTERLALLNQENNFSTFYKIDDVLNENNEITGTRVQLKIKYKESVEELV